jgi:hypothetical protein
MPRLIRRIVTLECPPLDLSGGEDIDRATFRVEVWSYDSTKPQCVYIRSHLGRIEVEEFDTGDFRLVGHGSVDNTLR